MAIFVIFIVLLLENKYDDEDDVFLLAIQY